APPSARPPGESVPAMAALFSWTGQVILLRAGGRSCRAVRRLPRRAPRRLRPGGGITLAQAGGQFGRRGCGELADALRGEDARDRAGGEVVLRRHDAGERAEEPVGLPLVGGDGGEEQALAAPGRGESGEAEGEVVAAADGAVAPALIVAQRAGQWPAATKPRDDGGGQVTGVAQRVGHALRRNRVHDDAGVPGQRPAGAVRAPERVGLGGRGAQPLRPAAAADPLAQVAAYV